MSLLALQRLRAVRLCIRSALQIDTTKIKKKKKSGMLTQYASLVSSGFLWTMVCPTQWGAWAAEEVQ